jgi:hypothetical protein
VDHDTAIVFEGLRDLELSPSQPSVYDRPIGIRLLYEDATSGAEHYLVRYPPGLRASGTDTLPPTPSWCSKGPWW